MLDSLGQGGPWPGGGLGEVGVLKDSQPGSGVSIGARDAGLCLISDARGSGVRRAA